MSKQLDDLEAVKLILQTLEPFETVERERILRWVSEKLGIPIGSKEIVKLEPFPVTADSRATDIKSFLVAKNPKTDFHLAAVVTYYYQFLAPESERKESIDATDLMDACRKGSWKRPRNATQTLVDAYRKAGILDRAGEKGKYKLNSVGENLVAMVLPGDSGKHILRRTNQKTKVKRK